MIWLMPILAGVCVVLQGGWNRQLGPQLGLAGALFANSVVFLLGAALVLLLVRMAPERWPEFLRVPLQPGSPWQWRAVLPGICGLVIVLGIPWGITQLGALRVMILVVAAQLVAGLIWDALVEGIPVDPWRLAGIGFSVMGAGIVASR